MVIKKIRRHSWLININICDHEREEIYTKLNTSYTGLKQFFCDKYALRLELHGGSTQPRN